MNTYYNYNSDLLYDKIPYNRTSKRSSVKNSSQLDKFCPPLNNFLNNSFPRT